MISYRPPVSFFNTLVHMKYGLGVYSQCHCHKTDGARSILAPLSLFLFIFHTRLWHTTLIVANWLQSHIIINPTIVTHLCYSIMVRFPHFRRSVTGSLHKHLHVCPLNIIFLAKRSSKRVAPTSLKQKALRQVINTSGAVASLLADIHSPSVSAPPKYLRSLSGGGS